MNTGINIFMGTWAFTHLEHAARNEMAGTYVVFFNFFRLLNHFPEMINSTFPLAKHSPTFSVRVLFDYLCY